MATLCPHRSAKLLPNRQDRLSGANTQNRRAEAGVVANVVRAVVRTVVRTIGGRTVRVVEDPRGPTDTKTRVQQATTVLAAICQSHKITRFYGTW